MKRKLTVELATLSGVALVQTPQQLYAVSPSWGCRKEFAPQLFNLHLDPSLERVTIRDRFPFPKVMRTLKKRMKVERRRVEVDREQFTLPYWAVLLIGLLLGIGVGVLFSAWR